MSKYPDIASYMDTIPEDRLPHFKKLRETINSHLDEKFLECISYNMLGWVVPLGLYPEGYHCNPKLPLPFMNLANQKGFIALYHMGLYADQELHDWFVAAYPKHCKYKLDMGKSCIRFKKMEDIPYDLVAKLIEKMEMRRWITIYETTIKTK